jgi:hypothetical protein
VARLSISIRDPSRFAVERAEIALARGGAAEEGWRRWR